MQFHCESLVLVIVGITLPLQHWITWRRIHRRLKVQHIVGNTWFRKVS